MSAVVIGAFVDRDLFSQLPAKEREIAVGAEIFRLLVFTEALVGLKEMAADLASDLRTFVAIVVVEIIVRSAAEGAGNQLWHRMRLPPSFDGAKRLSLKRLILC